MMEVQLSEQSKWHRGGFLSTLNRSFRLATKSKSNSNSPVEHKSIEQSLAMHATVRKPTDTKCYVWVMPVPTDMRARTV